MWIRFVDLLRCPVSSSRLRLVAFRHELHDMPREHVETAERVGIAVDDAFCTYVERGVLLAESGWMYPIIRGLPILLPYDSDPRRVRR